MECENLKGCPIYTGRMKTDSTLANMYKKNYCENDKYKCARYMVKTTVGKLFITSDLLPDMLHRAEKIIRENTK